MGELPLTVQAKLLRTLQNGEIQRLGADEPRRVNVRVIAATNRSLRDLVANGSFRADLYHRLSVYPVPIPPLRERGDDVLLLAGAFSNSTARGWAFAACARRPAHRTPCAATTGRATSASWNMSSAAPRSRP